MIDTESHGDGYTLSALPALRSNIWTSPLRVYVLPQVWDLGRYMPERREGPNP